MDYKHQANQRFRTDFFGFAEYFGVSGGGVSYECSETRHRNETGKVSQ
jgi:hypothetical protein